VPGRLGLQWENPPRRSWVLGQYPAADDALGTSWRPARREAGPALTGPALVRPLTNAPCG
jgi:hypothetical protein